MRNPNTIRVPARSLLYAVLGLAAIWVNDHGPHVPGLTWALGGGFLGWVIWMMCKGEERPPPPEPRERERG